MCSTSCAGVRSSTRSGEIAVSPLVRAANWIGFFYSRFLLDGADEGEADRDLSHEHCYHRLGTPQVKPGRIDPARRYSGSMKAPKTQPGGFAIRNHELVSPPTVNASTVRSSTSTIAP